MNQVEKTKVTMMVFLVSKIVMMLQATEWDELREIFATAEVTCIGDEW